MPHHVVNFGSLTAEIGWRVLGNQANFNGFRILASLLQRHRSTEVNQTLQDVLPSPGLVHYIYIFGASCPYEILPDAKFTRCPSLAFSYIGSVTARHSSSVRQPFVAWYTEWNYGTFTDGATYMAGRPSHWASAPVSGCLRFSSFLPRDAAMLARSWES